MLWDGDDYSTAPNTNQVPLIVDTNFGAHGVSSSTRYTHYSLLRTIEAGFGLPALGKAGSPSTRLLTGLIRQLPPSARRRYPAPRTVSIETTPKGRSTFSRR